MTNPLDDLTTSERAILTRRLHGVTSLEEMLAAIRDRYWLLARFEVLHGVWIVRIRQRRSKSEAVETTNNDLDLAVARLIVHTPDAWWDGSGTPRQADGSGVN